MIVLPVEAPPARRWLAHLVRAASGAIRAGDPFDDVLPFDASAVAALARREQVAALVDRGLAAGRIADPLPAAFREDVRAAWSDARRRSRVVREVAEAARRELAAGALDAAAVGALALLQAGDPLYAEPGLRDLRAAHLMLPPSDRPRAARRLRRLGFSPAGPRDAVGAERFVRRVDGVTVPLVLHTALGAGRGPGLGGDRFLAAHVRGEGARCRAAPVGGILFAATRLASASLAPWIGILDVHRLLEAGPDWHALLREARACGLRRPVYVALAAARELLRSPVPKEVLADLAPGPLRRRLLRRQLALGRGPLASGASRRGARPRGGVGDVRGPRPPLGAG